MGLSWFCIEDIGVSLMIQSLISSVDMGRILGLNFQSDTFWTSLWLGAFDKVVGLILTGKLEKTVMQ